MHSRIRKSSRPLRSLWATRSNIPFVCPSDRVASTCSACFDWFFDFNFVTPITFSGHPKVRPFVMCASTARGHAQQTKTSRNNNFEVRRLHLISMAWSQESALRSPAVRLAGQREAATNASVCRGRARNCCSRRRRRARGARRPL